MDGHPLIPKCPSILKLVAFCYVCACYGSSLPEECAPILARSRRQRIAINPEALSLLSYSGALASQLRTKSTEDLASRRELHPRLQSCTSPSSDTQCRARWLL